MLCTPGFWEDAYQALKEDALSGATKARRVLIFVATDSCDSIATLQILEHVLNKDNVPYGIYPVANEAELVRHAEDMLQDDAERSIILVNCGATEDITRTLSCGPGIRIYVLDSHRPLNIRNAERENSQVLVICDDAEQAHEYVEEGLGNLLESPSSSSQSEDDSEDDEDGNEGSDDENEGGAASRKRQRRETKERRRNLRTKIQAYYDRGASFASAAGCLAYDFASHLNKDDVSCLWKAIVSLTDHYVHQRLSHDAYMRTVIEYERKISQIGSGVDLLPPSQDGQAGAANVGSKRIQYKEDCHLVMLQHWSLADALFNSPYVATRLRTWKESGKEKIELMLAKMGFPLVECQQHWTHMSPKLKQKLSQKLQECAPQFGLVNFQFASFQKEDGYASISSTDAVHAITALLEVGFYDPSGSESAAQGGASGGGSQAEDGRNGSATNGNGNGGEATDFNGVESFWAAYECLLGRKKDLVQKGLELAMLLQKVIVSVGGAQLNRRTVYQCGHFRYLNLDEAGLGENTGLLAHPLVLERLAFFLQDAHAHMGRSHKPVVIVGPKLGDKVLVVGVTGAVGAKSVESGSEAGALGGNIFSTKFKKASQGIGAEYEASGFESNVIKMPYMDVQQFMDELITDM